MPKYLTRTRCKKCGNRMYITTLNERLYCKRCYRYYDHVLDTNEEIVDT